MNLTLQAVGGPVIRVVSARLYTPPTRVWFCDLDLAPDDVAQAPTSGKVTLTLGTAPETVTTLQGTIDPRGSGSFVSTSKVRMVAGGGGWDKPVTRNQFHSGAGVRSTDVYSATAALVGETVNDPAPIVLAPDVIRLSSGPAKDVFRERPWYVDLAGVTQVGARPSGTPDTSLELLRFDPLEQVGECSLDAVLLPGTTITDARILAGSAVVADVEQTFTRAGSRAIFWSSGSAPVDRFRSVFVAMVRDAVSYGFLRTYQYRYVQPASGNGFALQAITPGAPDLNPIDQWTGLSGAFDTLALSSVVVVGFTGDDPPQPFVVSYSPKSKPVDATIDASQKTVIGPSSAEVDIGDMAGLVRIGGPGGFTLVPTPWATALVTALEALAGSLTTGTLVSMAAGGTALTAALTALPPAATSVTKAA